MKQRQINLGVLLLMVVGAALVIVGELVQQEDLLLVLTTAGAALLLAGLFFAYWKGYDQARYIVVIAIVFVIGLALPEPYVSREASYALLIPPTVALVLASPIWVVGSALLVYIIILARAGLQGVYSDPIY